MANLFCYKFLKAGMSCLSGVMTYLYSVTTNLVLSFVKMETVMSQETISSVMNLPIDLFCFPRVKM